MPATPSPAQTMPDPFPAPFCGLRVAARSPKSGMDHGAATADPHPSRIALGTESGTPMPSGSPGRFSRIATALLYAVAQANPMAAH